MSFTVAIVGRPNVGKSTFFNRLLEERKAIVDDVSGVTRDRQYGESDWNGKSFNVIDTGGFVSGSDDVFEKEIAKQVMIAVNEANAIVFMVDAHTGLTDLDEAMANVLRRSTKPVFLTVNKVDNNDRLLEASEFYSMGFDHVFFIAAASGSGSGELLDAITELIPAQAEEAVITDEELLEEGEEKPVVKKEYGIPKFAIIGQPNVGKSSLLNALIGQERTIVSDIAGTTRDTIHTHYNLYQKEFILIDTAGIRRKNKVHEDLEFYSVIRAIKAVDEADVCLLLLDAEKGITAQDLNIYSLAARKGKGIVVLVNKWDLVQNKQTNTAKEYENTLKKKLAPFNDVPVLFISALEKTRIFKAIETALQVIENRRNRVSTSKLNEIMLKAVENYHAPVVRGHAIKIKFVTQLPTAVPSFAFFCNFPDDIKQPYKNYLENQLRQHFDLSGVPVRLFFRKK
ncbi:ribosome biogenesis GTPase Der [Terrimonas rubra]|uniref:GTPase Der n=1 Tax=Terrimonas rubra TaxID=1035890 RepID=A0ABW6AC66_9BACT